MDDQLATLQARVHALEEQLRAADERQAALEHRLALLMDRAQEVPVAPADPVAPTQPAVAAQGDGTRVSRAAGAGSQVAQGAGATAHDGASSEQAGSGRAWTRRALLLGGAGAATAGIAGSVGALPATADTGAMQFGASNNAGTSATDLTSSAETQTLKLFNTGSGRGLDIETVADGLQSISRSGSGLKGFSLTGYGVYGSSVSSSGLGASSGSGYGTYSRSEESVGVYGDSNLGNGVYAQSEVNAALRARGGRVAANFSNTGVAGPPTEEFNMRGDLYAPLDGSLWWCVATGTPGDWRMIVPPASQVASGPFVPLEAPSRVYDSRFTSPSGPITAGDSRELSVANAYAPGSDTITIPDVIPSGARAVTFNVTVTGPTAGGYLFVAPGGYPSIAGSTINWTAANAILANSGVVRISQTRELRVFFVSNSEGATTQFIIDVAGYFA